MNSESILLIFILILFVLVVLALFWAQRCAPLAVKNRQQADDYWRQISGATRTGSQLRRQLSRFEGARSADFSQTVTDNLESLNDVDDQLDLCGDSLQLLTLESPDADGRFIRNDYMRLWRVGAERRKLNGIGRQLHEIDATLESNRASVTRLNTVDDTIRERAQQIREHTVLPVTKTVEAERTAGIDVSEWAAQLQRHDRKLQHIIQSATDDTPFNELDELNGDVEMIRVAVGNLQTDIDTSATSRHELDERAERIHHTLAQAAPTENGDYWQQVDVMHRYGTKVMDAYPDFRQKREWELGQHTLTLGNKLALVTQALHRLAPLLNFLVPASGHARPETKQRIDAMRGSYEKANASCVQAIEAMPTLPAQDDSGNIDRSLRMLQSLFDEGTTLQDRYRKELEAAEHNAQRLWNKARTAWLSLGRKIRILPTDPTTVQYDRLVKRYEASHDSPARLDMFAESTQGFLELCETHSHQVDETRAWAKKQQKDIDEDSAFILQQTSEYACFKRAATAVQGYQAEYNRLLAQLNDKREGWLVDDFYESAAQLLDLLTRIRETTEQAQSQHDQLKRIRQDIDYYQTAATPEKRQTVDKEPIDYHVREARTAADFELAQKHLQDGRYFARKAYS